MDWHTLSETVKNFVEVLAIVLGGAAVIGWLFERYDRATDVLLELERKFNEPDILLGRGLIEDDVEYGAIVPILHTAVLEADEPVPLDKSKLTYLENEQLRPIDALLRFYILLYGIRRAKQVRDLPLKTCFRYWLTQYYCPYRAAFRAYVDVFYPTLAIWLRQDHQHGHLIKELRPGSYLLSFVTKVKRNVLPKNPLGAQFHQTGLWNYLRSKRRKNAARESHNTASPISFRDYVASILTPIERYLRHNENQAIERRRFFTPVRFGWGWNEEEMSNQFRRSINGRVLVITGSGISADSKIPTFRGPGGYWRNYHPVELATRKAFDEHPELIWEWYQERRDLIRGRQPNSAHDAIVQLATRSKQLLLVTQNVDDLHERARYNEWKLSKDQVVHIHGDIFVTRCMSCNYRRNDRSAGNTDGPRCMNCGAYMRPGVVWFDEELDPHLESRISRFLRLGPCDLVLVIGTQATFDYVRGWALQAAGHNGWLIEINPSETHLSMFANQVIRKTAADALQPLVTASIERGPIGLGAD